MGVEFLANTKSATNSDPRVSCTSALRLLIKHSKGWALFNIDNQEVKYISRIPFHLEPLLFTPSHHHNTIIILTLIKSINQDDDLHPSTCDHKCILQIIFIYHSMGSLSPTPLRLWAHPNLLKYSSVHGKENEAIHGRSTQTKG